MANPLKYEPKIKKAPLQTGGVDFRVGKTQWHGVQKFAAGVMDAATKVDAVLDHMDEVEDTNNMYRMLSEHDIAMGESIVAYEQSGANPDDYSQKMGEIQGERAKETTNSYKFKTANIQTQFNKAMESRKTATTLAAKKREIVLRAERASAELSVNVEKAYQAAIMQPSYEAGKSMLVSTLDEYGEWAMKNGVTTADKWAERVAKKLNGYDWYDANEQIDADAEGMKRRLADEKETLAQWGNLTPENILSLRGIADRKIKQNASSKADSKSEEIDKYDREYIDLRLSLIHI